MNTADVARAPQARAGSSSPAHAVERRRGSRRFLRHYLEMVAAMFVGMVVLGVAVRGALALSGVGYPAQYPELAALEMATSMSVGMVVWMRHRGHTWAGTLEMAGVMYVATVPLFPLLWLGVLSSDSLHLVEHAAMLPLMYLVMLRRRAEFTGSTHS